LDLLNFCWGGGSGLSRVKLAGDDRAAELGEHVGERWGGLGEVPGGAGAVLVDVGGVVSVQGVPGDREGHREELEGDGALDGFLCAVARVADAESLFAFFEADLDRPAV
jgi:hypothetical protein